MTDDRLLFRLDQWAASSGLRDNHLGTETAASDMKAAAARIRELEASWRRERKHDMSLHKDADEAIVDFYTQFMEEDDWPLSCMVSVAGIRSIIRHRSALLADIDALQARAERAEDALAALKDGAA